MKKLTIRDITCGALFCALICVGAFIKIPLPQLPVTIQVFFVLLAGTVLKPRVAFMAVGIYILLGLTGLPVFASGGGFGYVLMPSFGYMLGFLVAAPVVSMAVERAGYMASAAMGIAIIYALGIPYFWLITRFVLDAEISAGFILKFGLFTVLPGDILSGIAAGFLGKRLKKAGIFS